MLARTTKAWGVLGACLGSALACNQLLGIDEAAYDARLEANPASVMSGGSGGSAGSEALPGSGGTISTSGSGGTAHSHGPDETESHAGDAGDDGNSGPSGKGGSTGGGNSGGKAGANHGHGNDEGGTSGEGGGDGVDEPKEPCEVYCDEMDTQCQGEAKQYVDRSQCLRVCRLFPAGVVTEDMADIPDENSAACRLKYAEKARYGLGTEVADYCHKAGPSGEGICGSVCQGFCSLMGQVCTPEEAGESHFASEEECLATCEGLPGAGFSYSSSNPLVADGNHALCRLWHVTSAAMVDPLEHCEHALGITLCEAPPQ